MLVNNIVSRIKNLWQVAFVKDVAVLQVGNVITSLAQALTGIFLARLLQPELFGVFALSFSLAGLAGIFLSTGTQDALATLLSEAYAQKDGHKVRELLGFFMKTILILGLVSMVFAAFLPAIANIFYKDSSIGRYADIIILAVLFSSTFLSISSLALQVVGNIKGMAILTSFDQLTRFGLSLLFVFLGFGVWGAVVGHLVGAIIVFITSLIVWGRIKKSNPIFPSLRELVKDMWGVNLKKYLGFSFWIAIDRNLANLYLILPVVLMGIFVATSEVTFFKLAFGYVNLALSLLGPISILLNVKFPKMKTNEGSKLRSSFVKVSLYSTAASFILTAGAILVAPLAFGVIYGRGFLPSVNYVSELFVYGALFGIGVGLGPMWRAINRVKTSILINLIVLGTGVPLGLILIRNFQITGAVIMVTLWFTISHLISFIYLRNSLRALPDI